MPLLFILRRFLLKKSLLEHFVSILYPKLKVDTFCEGIWPARRANDLTMTFIELGFYYVTECGVQKPQCIICYEVLSSESM